MTQGVSPISLTLTGACRVYPAQEEPSANDQSASRLANLLFDRLRRSRPVHTKSNRAITVTEKERKQSRRWNNCVPDRFWHNSVQRWTNQNKGPQRIQRDALATQNWSNQERSLSQLQRTPIPKGEKWGRCGELHLKRDEIQDRQQSPPDHGRQERRIFSLWRNLHEALAQVNHPRDREGKDHGRAH